MIVSDATSPAATPITTRAAKSRAEVRRSVQQLTAILFILALALPLAGTFLHWDPFASSQENRRLAQAPRLPRELGDIEPFSAGFMAYFRDHFGFRNSMIRELALFRPREFNFFANSQTIIGKDGWLFYRHPEDRDLQIYRGLERFSESDLDGWQRLLENRQAWLAARNIPCIVIVIPNKQTIYPEFMPAALTKVRNESRLDQLISRLKKTNSKVQIIDPRPALLAAKATAQVYEKTDTHWTDLGAYIGYRLILDAVKQAVPDRLVEPRDLNQFDRKESILSGYLAHMLNLQDVYQERQIQLIPRYPVPQRVEIGPATSATTVDDSRLPRLAMLRDSFADMLFPMLTPHFSRGVYRWEYTFDWQLVEREKPGVVIIELVERRLDGTVPVDPPQ